MERETRKAGSSPGGSSSSTSSPDGGEKSFLVFGSLSVFFGNMMTLIVCGIVALNVYLFQKHMLMALWAIVVSLGLRRLKDFIMSSGEKDWLRRLRKILLKHPIFNAYFALSWLGALSTTFGFMITLVSHLTLLRFRSCDLHAMPPRVIITMGVSRPGTF